jgi:hypothetical protein
VSILDAERTRTNAYPLPSGSAPPTRNQSRVRADPSPATGKRIRRVFVVLLDVVRVIPGPRQRSGLRGRLDPAAVAGDRSSSAAERERWSQPGLVEVLKKPFGSGGPRNVGILNDYTSNGSARYHHAQNIV